MCVSFTGELKMKISNLANVKVDDNEIHILQV